MLSDFEGQQISLETYGTILSPDSLVKDLAERITRLLRTHDAVASCKGIGVTVPGIVDLRTGRVLNAPTLGWRDVEVVSGLASRTGLPVHIENAARACALAQMWLGGRGRAAPHSFVHVSVSDGVGVNGELVRGHGNMAGEFGHVPLNIEGPPCMCGANGCWEAYISNIATLSRYFGRDLSKSGPESLLAGAGPEGFTISDLITRARGKDGKAMDAIETTARYLGLGLGMLVNGLNPECVYIGGEITAAWNLVAPGLRKALAERVLTEAAARTPIFVAEPSEHPRLRGAAALVAAPMFAAPRVA